MLFRSVWSQADTVSARTPTPRGQQAAFLCLPVFRLPTERSPGARLALNDRSSETRGSVPRLNSL